MDIQRGGSGLDEWLDIGVVWTVIGKEREREWFKIRKIAEKDSPSESKLQDPRIPSSWVLERLPECCEIEL